MDRFIQIVVIPNFILVSWIKNSLHFFSHTLIFVWQWPPYLKIYEPFKSLQFDVEAIWNSKENGHGNHWGLLPYDNNEWKHDLDETNTFIFKIFSKPWGPVLHIYLNFEILNSLFKFIL